MNSERVGYPMGLIEGENFFMKLAVLLLSASLRRMLTLMVSIPTFIVGTLVRSVRY
jgi:hypothetical protein